MPLSWTGSASVPFFTVSSWSGEGQHVVLANSAALIERPRETLWKPLRVPLRAVEDLDPQQGRVRFDVFSFAADHCHERVGFAWTTLAALSSGSQAELALRGPTSRVAGWLTVTSESPVSSQLQQGQTSASHTGSSTNCSIN
jgi:hypothetical protein